MELYSTVLWHLGDTAALSHLSQHLVSIDRDAPQPWIATGNCFSLQRDHDEAMRCFRRAAQLSPGCPYAWTLCGYEAVAMEEYDRAIAFYRNAIRADSRHYNAWYGLGVVYLNMGKLRHAEHHFRRAAEINPSNSALLCCIGDVLEKVGNLPGALAVYDQACAVGSTAMSVYRRARVLVALGRIMVSTASAHRGKRCWGRGRFRMRYGKRATSHSVSIRDRRCLDVKRWGRREVSAACVRASSFPIGDRQWWRPKVACLRCAVERFWGDIQLTALQEAISALEPLIRDTPDEANVHFLLGKCYLRVGRNDNAMTCFTAAQELQPKLSSSIKATILARGEEEEASEEE